jgi:hypothetical protein
MDQIASRSPSRNSADVRFGSLADMAAGSINVRFTPKADIGTQPRDVRFVPQADISARPELFNLPYSAPDPRLGHSR